MSPRPRSSLSPKCPVLKSLPMARYRRKLHFFIIMRVCILFPSVWPVMFFRFVFLNFRYAKCNCCSLLPSSLKNTRLIIIVLSLPVLNICVLISDQTPAHLFFFKNFFLLLVPHFTTIFAASNSPLWLSRTASDSDCIRWIHLHLHLQ